MLSAPSVVNPLWIPYSRPMHEEDASKGGHSRRVMQSYQKWLSEGPEWSLLQLAFGPPNLRPLHAA